jgi:hypothetical protein
VRRRAASDVSAPAAAAVPGRLQGMGWDAAHIAALCGFAISQPLFNLLGKYPEFFVVRGSPRRDIVVFALAATLLPPAILIAIELVATLIDRRLRTAVHLVFVCGLVTLIGLQAVKHLGHILTEFRAVIVILIAAAATALYWRIAALRSLLSWASVAPLIFLALFLFNSPVETLVFPSAAHASVADVSGHVPVVLIVFDEFPINSLLTKDNTIDTVRYPNFAKLAAGSNWYRNATSVNGATVRAVPAILTGQLPKRKLLPDFAGHPRNIFTLLGRRYKLDAFETVTHLCPAELCKGDNQLPSFWSRMSSLYDDTSVLYEHLIAPAEIEENLPSVTTDWGNFETDAEANTRNHGSVTDSRVRTYERFVRSIAPEAGPTLNMVHIEMPHAVWQYLPSGHVYGASATALTVPGKTGDAWPPSVPATDEAWQRHLLQTGYTDSLLGQALARMKQQDVYDKSLLIVTADHGISFRAGSARRVLSKTSGKDLVFVPLFVKLPGQTTGKIIDKHVQTIDILPTIANVLGINIPWHVDGHSVLSDYVSDAFTFNFQRFSDATMLHGRSRTLNEMQGLFGTRHGWDGVYAAGPAPQLFGRPVSSLAIDDDAPGTADIDDGTKQLLHDLPRDSDLIPDPIGGYIDGDVDDGAMVAVAVNGRIGGVSRTFDVGHGLQYSVMVPEQLMHAGANDVRVYVVDQQGSAYTLHNLPLAS